MKNPNILIETPVLIELEGSEVLSFIVRGTDYTKYSIIGFPETQLTLVDYRQKGLEAIDEVLSSKRLEIFPEMFCFPALARISQLEKETLIELLDLHDYFEPETMLWIATDLQEPIPDYEYSFLRIAQRTTSCFSIVSIFNYHRFRIYFEGIVDQIVLQV